MRKRLRNPKENNKRIVKNKKKLVKSLRKEKKAAKRLKNHQLCHKQLKVLFQNNKRSL